MNLNHQGFLVTGKGMGDVRRAGDEVVKCVPVGIVTSAQKATTFPQSNNCVSFPAP